MAEWTLKDIRSGLIEASDEAVKKCHRRFHKHRQQTNQGLERIFEEQFFAELDEYHPGWKVARKPSRQRENPNGWRPKGWIDGIVEHTDSRTRVGLEFKVCQFPRIKSTSPRMGTYDVGQLAWDFGSLRDYSLNFAYCVVVLHGPFVEAKEIDDRTIERWFHNAMYADFQASMLWGHYNKKLNNDPARRANKKWYDIERNFQIRSIKQMRFDKPYKRTSTPANFCRLYSAQRLAVIGLCSRTGRQ